MSAPLFMFDRFATDPQLLGHVLGGDTHAPMRASMKAALAEPLTPAESAAFDRVAGGRGVPLGRVKTLGLVVGRGGGKTQGSAACVIYLATCVPWPVSPGQVPVALLLAGDKEQATVDFKFVLGQLQSSSLLAQQIAAVSAQRITLTNGVEIRVGTSDLAAVRGPSYVCVVADELATWPTSLTSASPDVETIAAARPGLARMPGSLLVLISSPFAQEGVLYETYRRSFGVDDPHTLVVQGGTLDFNPTFDRDEIDRALREDPARFAAEYLATFRTDIAGFVDAGLIDQCTRTEPRELPRRPATPNGSAVHYVAGLDASGGRADATAVAVAHDEDGRTVIDAVRRWPAPHDPAAVARQVADLLRTYGLRDATADQYAAGFSRAVYREAGVTLRDAPGNRSDAYLHLLPLLTQARVELPPDPQLRIELMGLQRRVRSGGRDVIDHRPGAQDDCSNSVALAAWAARRTATQGNQVHVFRGSALVDYERAVPSVNRERSLQLGGLYGVLGGPFGPDY